MPVNDRIRESIDNSIVVDMSVDDFRRALKQIIVQIFSIDRRNTDEIMNTSAYLSYRISSELIQSGNFERQYEYGSAVTDVLHRFYNNGNIVLNLSSSQARNNAMQTFANIYTFHARLLSAKLRLQNPADPPGDALIQLQIVIGRTLGPWRAHIQVVGDKPSDPNIRVKQMREANGHAAIMIGHSPLLNINLNRIRAVTWNMQGSSAGTDYKWRTGVLNLAREYDILCLQEFGDVPGSARPVTSLYTEDQFGVQYLIEEYSWNAGTTNNPENYRIFFFQVNRLRVHLAFVLPTNENILVHSFTVVADGLNNRIRPAVGIRISRPSRGTGTDITFFTFHGMSGGGVNDPRMIREISRHTQTPFVVLGDFNQDPSTVNWISPPAIAYITEAHGTTHGSGQSARMFDYAVSSNSTIADQTTPEQIIQNLPSDHRAAPFRFDFPF